jgi:hypothetical protein
MNIELNETPLEKGLQDSVVNLFRRSDFKTLERIIEAEAKKSAFAATNKALESGKFPNYTDAANAELAIAIRYQTALEVLQELKQRKETFTLITSK